MENKRLQWNLDPRFKKGKGIDKILGLPNDGFLLNSLKQLFSVRTQSTFRFLEMHSKWRYKICICSVILGELSNLQGLQYHFPGNSVTSVSRKWEFFYSSVNHIFEFEQFSFPFPTKK